MCTRFGEWLLPESPWEMPGLKGGPWVWAQRSREPTTQPWVMQETPQLLGFLRHGEGGAFLLCPSQMQVGVLKNDVCFLSRVAAHTRHWVQQRQVCGRPHPAAPGLRVPQRAGGGWRGSPRLGCKLGGQTWAQCGRVSQSLWKPQPGASRAWLVGPTQIMGHRICLASALSIK